MGGLGIIIIIIVINHFYSGRWRSWGGRLVRLWSRRVPT